MKSEHQFPFFNTKEFIENRLIRGSSLLFEKIQTPPKKKRITQQNHNDSSQFLNQSFVNASEYSSFLIKNSYQNTSNKKQRSQSNHKSHNINFKQPKQQSISPLLKRSTPYDINNDIKLKSINESQLSNNNKKFN